MMENNLLAVASTVLLVLHCATASQQKITFHEQTNCLSGRSQTITNTDHNLGSSWVTNANSTLIVGVWRLQIRNSTNGITNELSFSNTNPPNGGCAPKSQWPVAGWQNHTIIGATRFGPADMTTSQLLLYTGVDFSGTLFTLSGDKKDLGSITVRSYAHFSNDTWTLHTGTAYNGTNTTLSPASKSVRDNFVIHTNVNYRVGSVRKSSADNIMATSFILAITSILALVKCT